MHLEGQDCVVRLRIVATPHEREIDGVSLESFMPGQLREVSATVGSWLIAEGYAELEMRSTAAEDHLDQCESFGTVNRLSAAQDRRRRRSF